MFTSLFQIYFTIETKNLYVYFPFLNLWHHINNESACLFLIFKFYYTIETNNLRVYFSFSN